MVWPRFEPGPPDQQLSYQLLPLQHVFLFSGALTLTLKNIDVPSHSLVGQDARLTCEFDMEGGTLYSVKWYKDEKEFYRYVPGDRPKLQVFRQDGILVDVSRQKI
jgi:hypothetical protein